MKLNLIGPGRLGKTLACLWRRSDLVEVGAIVGRSVINIHEAISFIGDGTATPWEQLKPADVTLLATPDAALEESAHRLVATGSIRPGQIVIHCSGALSSAVLEPLRVTGARIASIHPLFSFADPANAVNTFQGTWCGYEGDGDALGTVIPLFEHIGAHCFAIDASRKTLYHAGAVLACNNLTALIAAALRSMEAAGVGQDQALSALCPLIDGTLANIRNLGTAKALTGPVVRADAQTVAAQNLALERLDPILGSLYRALGVVTLDVASPGLTVQQREELAKALSEPTGGRR